MPPAVKAQRLGACTAPRLALGLGVAAALLACPTAWAAPAAAPSTASAAASTPVPAAAPIALRIVGGLTGVNQFTRHEEPFWTQELPRLSGGRLRADIVAFDRAGIRGQDMLRLIQLGVVPFGTALVSLIGSTDPLITAPDLAGLNPDLASLRRHTTAYRPYLDKLLRERHGIELLAVYVYPAQMLFCRRAFGGLSDLTGRRIRTASPTQSDWVAALGATPVSTPFAELPQNLRNGNVDCAITGSMSGFTIGLHELTSHLLPMPVTWGMSIFGANVAAWQSLPPEQRLLLRQELLRLEQAIWAEAERETGEGVRCLTGAQACGSREPGRMTALPIAPADEQRGRSIFAGQVLARWVQRCGSACANAWNQTIAPLSGVEAKAQ